MKKLLLAATLAFVATAGSAMAQTQVTVMSDALNVDRKGFYVGGNLGSNLDSNSKISGGIDVGYQFKPYLRAELTGDYMWRVNGDASMVMANLIGQYRVPNTSISPYVLAGTGVGFNTLGTVASYAEPVYNVGGGVRVGLTDKLEADLRYRYIGHYATNGFQNLNLLTVGMNYRF